jgi:4-hydroxy-3-methylbut-2-enyl diphosphate reductase
MKTMNELRLVGTIGGRSKKKMRVVLAAHYGMCFGVRDALRATHRLASEESVTVLGQLVHNPVVDEGLEKLGVGRGALDDTDGEGAVVFTAHGVSDRDRQRWAETGRTVLDTTCPLVSKAHNALGGLVAAGYRPLVIGRRGHVEVEGLVGDHPGAVVIENFRDLLKLPSQGKFGVISQTTQPQERVHKLVEQLRRCRPECEVKFINTVCQPTRDRQSALVDLCRECEVVVVVGGANSNNTGELVGKVESLGVRAVRVQRAEELSWRWFRGVSSVGVTAGTSTLDETVKQVFARLQRFSSGERE